MRKRLLLGGVLFGMLLCGLLLGHATITTSKANEENLEFQKVMSHLEVIAKEVHPTGTEENDRVKEYLRGEFKRMGCEVWEETFTAVAYTSVTDHQKVPYVNFLITLDVPETTEGVMLVSHYDSTPGGPGAADDGISVASMLVALEQSMTTYRAGKLTNDMYFLFTDGEELGLIGATHFVNHHSDMREYVKLVANFEARGNDGALLMFQTSPNSNRLIHQLKKAVSNVDAFSVAASIYETMPNDTDLTCFLDAGYPSCLNFAMIDGSETYHQATDTYENISRDSAYRYYETVTELANYFGTADLNQLTDDEDAVYFPTIGGSIFVLSSAIANGVTALLAVMLLGWIIFLLIRRKVSGKELLKALGFFVTSILGTTLFTKGYLLCLEKVLKADRPIDEYMRLLDHINIGLAVMICFWITALAIYFSKHAKTHQEYLLVAAIICAMGGIALMVFFDSLIYLFLFPLLILFLQSVISYNMERKGKNTKSIHLLFAISMIFTMAIILYPLIKVVFDCFGNGFILYYGLLEAFGVYLINICNIGTLNSDLKEKELHDEYI